MKKTTYPSRARRLMMLALLCLASMTAWAYDFEVNGIYYNKNGNNATVTFRDNNYNSYSGEVRIPTDVYYDGAFYLVTAIGDNAFRNCDSLTRVVIHGDMTSIGNDAFNGCTALERVNIPSTVTSIGSSAFYGCTSLDGIVIPEGVTTINSHTFYNCSSLTAINIPAGVTSIKSTTYTYSFEGCNAIKTLTWNARNCSTRGKMPTDNIETVTIGNEVELLPGDFVKGSKITEVNIPESVSSIDANAFQNCTGLTEISIPESVSSIGSSAFQNCTGLTEVTIPSGMTNISNNLFDGCSSLSSVTLPQAVTNIGEGAFQNCTALPTLTIPAGVTSIGSSAFSGCTLLDGIVIPEGVTAINSHTFYNCSSLTAINIPAGVTSIKSTTYTYSFEGCNAIKTLIWNARNCSTRGKMPTANIETVTIGNEVTLLPGDFVKGSKITEVSIPESVSSIGANAFQNCTSLTEVSIPSGVTNISNNLFDGCSSLASVTLPQGLTGIGDNAFQNCTALPTLTIPAGVTSIGSSAFYGCTLLDGIVIPEGVTAINSHTFYNCSSLTAINIPAGVTSIKSTTYTYSFEGCNAIKTLTWNARNCSTRGKMPTANIETVTIGDEVTLLPDDFVKGSKITEVSIPGSVTSIGANAFMGCTGLTEVDIPGSVISIGSSAFQECTGLTEVDIPSGVTTISNNLFNGCSSLASVTLPQAVTNIGEGAFQNCTALPMLTIPAGVTSIGSSAFSGCTLLDGIVIPEGVTAINSHTFYNCSSLTAINIPAGVTSIKSTTYTYSFEGCNAIKTLIWNARNCSTRGKMPTANIETVTIGDEVTLLPNDFVKGSRITEVNIPESVTSIGANAFQNCTSLTEVTIPSGVTSISNYLFDGCTSLASVTLPQAVTSIGDYAFQNCIALPTLTIPAGVTSIGSYAFHNCTSLDGIVIPEGVTAINSHTFYNCSSLTAINIPAGVTSIKSTTYTYSFEGCNAIKTLTWNARNCSTRGKMPTANIETVTIGNEVELLPGDFVNGSKITEVNIPASVDSIGKNAFLNCDSLIAVTSRALIPPTMAAQNCFSCYDTATLYVSKNAINDYNSTDWWNLFINTVGVDFDAEAFEGDSLYYKITSETEVCVTYRDLDLNSYSGDIRIPSKTIIDGIVYDVTAIGDSAFSNCTELTSVRMPYSIKSIGKYAFYQCDQLDNVIIPDSVKTIGNSAFNNCDSLKVVNLGQGVTFIDNTAFSETSIKELNLPSSLQQIGYGAFDYCPIERVLLPKSVTSILYTNPFAGCNKLTEIVVENGNPKYDSRNNCNAIIETATNTIVSGCKNTVFPIDINYIGHSAFWGVDLDEIIIPNTIIAINASAFGANYRVKNLDIPNSVTYIGNYAFEYLYELQNIVIPNSVIQIGFAPFMNTSVTSIVVEEGNPNYDSRNNCNAIIEKSTNMLVQGCQNTIIPNTVEIIGVYALYGQEQIHKIDIPNSTKSILNSAFSQCYGLEEITIGNGVSLIGHYALASCFNLRTITCKAVLPPVFEDSTVFIYAPKNFFDLATLYVPIGSVDAYRADANWGQFVNIVGINMDESPGDIDGDGRISIGDVTSLINIMLTGGTAPSSGDVDGDGKVNISDITALINMLLNM